MPSPLQLFWPLHAFFALLQLPWPLHELMPMQCTAAAVFSIVVAGVVGFASFLLQAAANKLPAARAIIVPVRSGFFIRCLRVARTNLASWSVTSPLAIRSLAGEVTPAR